MVSKMLSLLLISAVLCLSLSLPGFAQNSQSDQQKKTEKVRAKIKKLGLGERVKVTVKLYSDSSYKGYVSQANEDDFVVVDKTGSPNTLKYSDVKSVGGRNLSTGAKIGIGVGIGVGSVLLFIALIFASLND